MSDLRGFSVERSAPAWRRAFAFGALLVAPALAIAGPQGGQIVGGAGSIQQVSSAVTQVNQLSSSMAVNWNSFNVAQGEAVRFVQPNASAIVLNRILDQNPSSIFGRVDANGQVFLINTHGILFGETAELNVGGLMASGLDMSVDDFMAGKYNLAAVGLPGSVINHGLIAAATGGSVVLAGGQVINTGLIRADYGRVTLAGAEAGYVDFDGDGLMRFEVTGELKQKLDGSDAAVANSGVIQAKGGQVVMEAAAAKGVFDQLINNSGVIEAAAISVEGGEVRLVAAGGDVVNTGTITVASQEAAAGTVHIEATDGNILDTGKIEATSVKQTGGTVELVSNADTIVDGGTIQSGSVEATGGTIEILGDRVAVVGPSRLGSTGGVGGGDVLIGGDFQGRNPAVRNASKTVVGPDAYIDVSALNSGSGGRVIVWSDDYTRFFGTVSARGPPSGYGGFVEVSSHGVLSFDGYVDASAAPGRNGTLLLDPTNVSICSGGGCTADNLTASGTNPVTFSDASSNNPSELRSSTLQTQLASTNVIVTTSSPDTDAGNLTVNATITWNSANSLTLQADNNLTVSQAITNSGSGGLSLSAGGAIAVNAGITLAGGALSASGTSFTSNASGAIDTGAGTVTLAANTISLGATLTGTGAVILQPSTAGTSIGIGGASGTLQLSAATIANIANGHSLITIGLANGTGGVNINAITFNDPVVIQSPSGGTISVNGALTGAGDASVTLTGATTLNNDIVTADQSITITGNVKVGDTHTVTLNTATAGAGNITITGTVDGDATTGAGETLKLISGSGTIGVSGIIGGTTALNTLELQSNNAGNTGAVTLSSAVSVGTLTTFDQTYNVSLLSNGGTITNAVAFTNNGTLTLGQAGGTQTYAGGLDTTGVAGTVTLNGTLQTTNAALTIGSATLGSTVTLAAGTNKVTVGGTLTGGANALTVTANDIDLSTGILNGTGAIVLQPAADNVSIDIGSPAGGTGTLDISDADLAAIADGHSSITIGRATTGAHTIVIGTVSVTDPLNVLTPAGGSIKVSGAINATGNASVTLDGSGATTTLNADITTADQDITISDSVVVQDGATVTLSTGTGGGGNILITGTVDGDAATGAVETLKLISGSGTIGINGAIGSTTPLGVLELQSNNAGNTGAVTLSGAVSVGTLTTFDQTYNVSLLGNGGTITNAVAFTNNGTLTLGQPGGTQTYAGGLDTTGVAGTVTLNGTVKTTNAALILGAATLGSAVTLDTAATTTAGDLTFGAITGGGNGLTLKTGAAVAGADISATSTISGVTALTLQNVGGTATFNGAVTVTSLSVDNTVASVALLGATGAITNAVAFANTGALTLGQAGGTQTYTGGLDTTGVGGTVTLNGTLQTTNTALTVGAVTLGSVTTLIAGTNTVTLGVVTAGSNAFTVTADEIDLGGALSGSGALVLQPSTAGQAIQIGSTDPGAGTLHFSTTEISNLTDGFSGITIGRSADGTGAVTIASNVSFNDNLTIVGGSIASNATVTSAGNSVTFTARSGDITDGNAGITPDSVTDGNNISAATIVLNASGNAGTSSSGGLEVSSVSNLTINVGGNFNVRGSSATLTDLAISVNPATGGTQTYSLTGFTGLTFGSALTEPSAGNLLVDGINTSGALNISITHTGNGNISLRGDGTPAITIGSGNVTITVMGTAGTSDILDAGGGGDGNFDTVNPGQTGNATEPNIVTSSSSTIISFNTNKTTVGAINSGDIDVNGTSIDNVKINNVNCSEAASQNCLYVSTNLSSTTLTLSYDPTTQTVSVDATAGNLHYIINENCVTGGGSLCVYLIENGTDNLNDAAGATGASLGKTIIVRASNGNIYIADSSIANTNCGGADCGIYDLGSTPIQITAVTGSIGSMATGGGVNIRTSGALTLSAATGIGAGCSAGGATPCNTLTAGVGVTLAGKNTTDTVALDLIRGGNGAIYINSVNPLQLHSFTINSGTGDLSLTANNIDLGQGTLSAFNVGSSNVVTLRPISNGTVIDIGGADVAGSTLGLSDTELDKITAGEIDIGSTTNTGGINVTQSIGLRNNAPILVLLTTGTTNETGSGALSVATLRVGDATVAAGAVGLNPGASPVNDVDFFEAHSGNLTFGDLDDLTVGGTGGLNGIIANNNVVLTVTTSLQIDEAINVGANSVNLRSATAGGLTINQAVAGTITANMLSLGIGGGTPRPTGAVTLNSANHVGTLQGLTSSLSFTDADALTLDDTPGINAGTALLATGDVVLVAPSIQINQPISASGVNVDLLSSGTIGQTVAGTITANTLRIGNSGTPATTVVLGSANDVNKIEANSAALSFNDVDDLTVGDTGGMSGITASGDVILASTTLQLDEAIAAGANDVDLQATSTIAQAVGANITADALRIGTAGTPATTVTLTNAGNSVAKLEANSGALSFTNNGALVIGDTGGLDGVTVSGDLVLTATSLSITEAIVAGANDVDLRTTGGIGQSGTGTITADTLRLGTAVTPVGGITSLTLAGNDINELEANSTSRILYADSNSFTIGEAGGLNGVAAGGPSSLTANGDESKLTVSEPITVTGATLGLTADKMDIAATVTATNIAIQPEGTVDTDAIDLGSNTDLAANTLELSNTELGFLTANSVRIGSIASTSLLTITAPIAPANTTSLDLRSGGDIVDGNATGDDITVSSLSLTGQNIGFDGATLDALEVSVDTLTTDTAASNGVQLITEANGLTGLSMNAGAGQVALTLTAGGIDDTDGSVDIIANSASITLLGTSATAFGSATNSIELQAPTFTIDTSAGNGAQYILESSGGSVQPFLLAGTGTIQLVAIGGLSLHDGAIKGGDISLTGQSILDADAGNTTANVTTSTGKISLKATGSIIGFSGDPVDVAGVTDLTVDSFFGFAVNSVDGSVLNKLTMGVNGDGVGGDTYVLTGFPGLTVNFGEADEDSDGISDVVISNVSSTSYLDLTITAGRGDIYLDDPSSGGFTAIRLSGGGNITLNALGNGLPTEGDILDLKPSADISNASSQFNLITDSASTITLNAPNGIVGTDWEVAGPSPDIDVAGTGRFAITATNNCFAAGGNPCVATNVPLSSISLTVDPVNTVVDISIPGTNGTYIDIDEVGFIDSLGVSGPSANCAQNVCVNIVQNGGSNLDFSLTALTGDIILNSSPYCFCAIGSGNVTLKANAGGIFDGVSGAAAANISTLGQVVLSGATGISQVGSIGSVGNPVVVDFPSGLSLARTNDGLINVEAQGSVILNGFQSAGLGDTTITSNGTLTINTDIAQSGTLTLRVGTVDIGLGHTIAVSGAGAAVQLYTLSGAQSIIVGGASCGGFCVTSTELAAFTDYDELVIGEDGVQSGQILLHSVAPAVTDANITVNSNVGSGSIYLDDATGIALSSGTGNITLRAGTGSGLGGIFANTTNGTAEIATTGQVTLTSTGTIGSSSARIQFPAGQGQVSVTGATNVFFGGLGDLTLGPITTTGTLDVLLPTGLPILTLGGAVSVGNGVTLEADEIDIAATLASSVANTGTVILRPTTDSTSIGIGGGAGTLDLSTTDLGNIADGFAAIQIGRSTGQHVIHVNAIGFTDPVTIQAPAGTGAIFVDGQITGSGNASVTLNGSVPTTLAAGIVTADQNITINDPVTIAEAGNIALNTGAAGGGNILVAGALDGTAGGATEQLQVISGTGTITFAGAVGSTDPVALTLQSNVASNTGAVSFNGNLAAPSITTFGQNYAINFNGSSTSVTGGATNLLNTGNVAFGDGGDTLSFAGGLTHTAGTNSIAGNLGTTNTALNLNSNTTIAGTSTLAAGSGLITLGATTLNNGVTLNLGTGGSGGVTVASVTTAAAGVANLAVNVTGAVNFTSDVVAGVGGSLSALTLTNSGGATFGGNTGSLASPIGSLVLTATTGTVQFSGNLFATTLTDAGGTFALSFLGGTTSVGTAGLLGTSGTVTFGNGGDALTFTNGVTHTAGANSIGGSVTATNAAINLDNNALGTSITANSQLAGGSGQISLGDTVLGDGFTLTLGAGGTGGVSVDNIAGTAGGTASNVTFNVAGLVSVPGTIGTDIGTLTVTNSGGSTFGGAVNAATVALTNTTGTITFNGALTATTLSAAANPFGVALNGATTTVTNAATFANTGTVAFGNGGDVLTFTGGVTHTAGASTVGGQVRTAAQPLTLGAASLSANSTLDTTNNGGSAAGADLTVGAVTGNGFDLTLNAGNGAGSDIIGSSVSGVGTLTVTQADTTTFSGAVGATAVTLTDTNGAITFNGNLTATTLNTAGQTYSVLLNGATTTVTNAVTFSNTGGVTLGNGGDVLTFTGGLISTASTTSLGGTVRTAAQPLTLGAVTLLGASALDTTNNGGSPAGNDLTVGAVTGGGFDLSLNAGTGAGSDIIGTSVSGVGILNIVQSDTATFSGPVSATTVTLTDTNGAITFNGTVTATALNTAAQTYSVALNGATTTIANAATFSNTGGVTLGNGGDVLTFTGGLVSTASTTSVGGTVRTAAQPLTLGAVTLTANSTLDTTNNGGSAAGSDLTVGAVTGGGFDLALNAGNGAGSDIIGSSVAGVGILAITQADTTSFSGNVGATTVTLTDTNGAITFNGNLTATTLNTAAQTYSVALNGATTTITNAATFSNTGGVTLGNGGDVLTFTGGLTSTASTTSVGGTVRTAAQPLNLGAVNLVGASTLDTTNNGASAAGNDVILGAVTGNAFTLALNAGTGAGSDITGTTVSGVSTLTIVQSDSATFSGAVSATTVALTDTNLAITFNGNLTATNLTTAAQTYAVALNGAATSVTNAATFLDTGAVTFGNGGDVLTFSGGVTHTAGASNLNGTLKTSGGGVNLNALTLAGNSSIDTTNGNLSPVGAGIVIGSVPGNAFSLALTGGTGGSINVGAVGGTTPLTSFTVNSAAVATLADVHTSGDQSITATTINLGGANYLSDDGNITLNGPVQLTGTGLVTIDSNADNDATVGFINVIGNVTDPGSDSSLTVNADTGQIDVASISVNGPLDFVGGTTVGGNHINLNGINYTSATGAVTFDGAVETHSVGDLHVNSGGGNAITFNQAISDPGSDTDLYLDAGAGNVALNGAIGVPSPLHGLFITLGGTINLSSFSVVGTFDVSAGTINLVGNSYQSTAGSLTFDASTAVNLASATPGDVAISAFGTVTLSNVADPVVANGITVTAAAIDLKGNSYATSDAQTYNGPVTFSGAGTTTLSTAGLLGNDIVFSSTIDDGATTDTSLVVNAGALGNVTFGGAIGAGSELLSLVAVSGNDIALNGGTINVSDFQTYTGPVTLGAAATLTSSGAGNIDFQGTVDGGYALAVDTGGATIFEQAVGGGTALASLTTDFPGTAQLDGGSVDTTGAQTYNDVTTLGADTTLTGVNVSFNSTLDSPTTAHSLVVNDSGTTTFAGVVGGTNPLFSVVTDALGTTALNGGSITTTDLQTYNDNVSLGAPTGLAGTVVTFNGSITGNGNSLDVTGDAAFGDAVTDAVTGLASLTVSGTTGITAGTITTSGLQDYAGAVTLGADSTLTGVNISFDSTLDGAHALILNDSGTTTLAGAVGSINALASLQTDSLGTTAINGGAVATTGAQTYNDAVTLGADTQIDGVNVTFGSTLESPVTAHSLLVNDSGTTTFTGIVGGSGNPLSTLQTDALGTTAINGGFVTTTGAQTYDDSVTIGNPLVLASTAGGNIQLNGAVTTTQVLGISTTGDITMLNGSNNIQNTLNLAGTVVQVTNGGPLTLGTLNVGDLTVTSTGVLNLGQGHVAGNLTATSNGGAINQTAALDVDGATSLDAGAGDVNLTNLANTFGTLLDGTDSVSVVSATNVFLYGMSGIDLGPIDATSLDVQMSTGNISNLGGALNIGGVSSFTANATGASIAVDNTGNIFGGTVTFHGAGGLSSIKIVDSDTGGLDLGGLPTTTTLDARSGGSITQTGSLTVTGTTTLVTGNGSVVVLADPTNDFGLDVNVLSIGGNHTLDVTLQDKNSITLGTIDISRNLNVTANGSISGSQPLTIGGRTDLNANGNDIDLHGNNSFLGNVGVSSGRDVTLVATVGDMPIDVINITGTLTLSATNGAIVDGNDVPPSPGPAAINPNITATGLVVQAGDFGDSSDPIEIDLPAGSPLSFSNSAYLNLAQAVSLSDISINAGVTFDMTAQQITVNHDFGDTGANIRLVSRTNIYADGAPTSVIHAATLYLEAQGPALPGAQGIMGTIQSPILLDVPNSLGYTVPSTMQGLGFVNAPNFDGQDFDRIFTQSNHKIYVIANFTDLIASVQGSFITAPSFVVDASQFRTDLNIFGVDGAGLLLPWGQCDDEESPDCEKKV